MALILVVDDEVVVREVLGRLVRAAGHEVEDAADGPSALERCRTLRPDLVVTDLQMPDMDGLELAARMREDHPAVKVLAISGYDALLEQAKAMGLAVIRKPCRFADVARAIERALTEDPSGTVTP